MKISRSTLAPTPSCASKLSTIPEGNESSPQAGCAYLTTGGETLTSLSVEVYGDERMVLALREQCGFSADEQLASGIELLLPELAEDVEGVAVSVEEALTNAAEVEAIAHKASEALDETVEGPPNVTFGANKKLTASTATVEGTTGSITSSGMSVSHRESTSDKNADGSTDARVSTASGSLNKQGGLSVGVVDIVTQTSADGSSNAAHTTNTTTLQGSDVTISGKSSTTHKSAEGDELTESSAGSVALKGGDTTITHHATVKEVNVDGLKGTESRQRDIDLMLTKDVFELSASQARSVATKEGGSDKETSSYGVGLNKKSLDVEADATVTHTEADGSSATRRGGGSAHLYAKGVRVGAHGGETITDSEGNVFKHDHKAGVEIIGDKVIVTGRTAVETTQKDAEGGRHQAGANAAGGMTLDQGEVSMTGTVGVSLEDTNQDGDLIGQDYSGGLDIANDRVTLRGKAQVNFTQKRTDGGHSTTGANSSGGVTVGSGDVGVTGRVGISHEVKTVNKHVTRTIAGEGAVGFDSDKRDISLSTKGTARFESKGYSTRVGGKIALSLQDGVAAEATYHLKDHGTGIEGQLTGGVQMGAQGGPRLVGDVEINRTNTHTGVVTGHGVGASGGVQDLNIGYRYTATRPDGHLTGAHVDVLLSRDQPRLVVGANDLRSTTEGTRTKTQGVSGALLLGKDDVTVIGRNVNIDGEAGKILPTSYNTYGGYVSFQGKQLTTLGDPISDEKSPHCGLYPVDTSRKVGGGGGVDTMNTLASVSGAAFGIGGALSLSAHKEIQFRTHLGEEEARALGKDVQRKKFLQYLPGLTLVDAPIAVPDLSAPEAMKVGDHVRVETYGNVEASVFGSAAILLQAGARFSVTGDFELIVEKTADNIMEVEYVPTRVLGARLFVDAFVADAYVSQAVAQQIGQKFRFDLTTKAGKRAYDEAMGGKFPGGIEVGSLNPTRHNLEVLQRAFPLGIDRLRVSRTTSRERAAAVKAGWLFLSSGARHARTRTVSMVSDGKTTANQKVYSRSTQRNTLICGTEENGMTGCFQSTTVKSGPGEYTTTLDGYKATAYFSDTKIRGDEYASEMIELLNKDLDAGLAKPAVEASRGLWAAIFSAKSRRVEAAVELTPTQIGEIAANDDTAFAAIGERFGITPQALQLFSLAISASHSDVVAAECVDDFLRVNGRPGLGALLKLAKMSSDDVTFITESGAYQGVLKECNAYLLANPAPMDPAANKKALTKRYRTGEKLAKELDSGLEILEDDPVMALPENQDERTRFKTDMQGKQEAVDGAITFEHLRPEEGLALWNTLERGWTTGVQARAQERITRDVGMTVHESGWTHTRAAAFKEADRLQEEVDIRTTHRWFPVFGDERTQVSASIKRSVDENEGVDFESLTFEARLIDEELRWQGMNNTFVNRINKAYGLDFGRSHLRTKGEQSIVLRHKLSLDDLNRIVLQSPAVISAAIKAAGLNSQEAEEWGEAISFATNREALLDTLTQWVAKKGIIATGALHRIATTLDATPDLKVDSFSGAIGKELAALSAMINRDESPIDDKTTLQDVLKRFTTVRKTSLRIQQLRERVLDYPFYSVPQQQEILTKLDELSERQQKSLSLKGLTHDGAVDLSLHLQKARCSLDVQEVAHRLHTDAGLGSASSSAGGNAWFGETLQKEEEGLVFRSSGVYVRSALGGEGTYLERVSTHAAVDEDLGIGGVEVNLKRYQAEASKAQLKAHFIAPLDKHLNYGAGSVRRLPETPHSRLLNVKMAFSRGQIQELCELDSSKIKAATKASHFSPKSVERMIVQLREAASGVAQAEVLGDFMARRGLEGMGALKALLGITNEGIEVKSSNRLAELLVAEGEEVLEMYQGTSIEDTMSKDEIAQRFNALHRAEEKVQSAKQMVSADPFSDESVIVKFLEECDALVLQLQDAFNPGELGEGRREKLDEELAVGWTTSQQDRVRLELA